MVTRLTISPPSDYVLARDVCSYGYFLLAPNVWDPRRQTLTRPLNLEEGVATLVLSQPDATPWAGGASARGAGALIELVADRRLSAREKATAKRLISRMLHLGDAGVGEFHRVDSRWAASGRGRLFRSPTLFEDVVKTVTSCNVTWPGTVRMNRRLCEVVGEAFPTPAQLARKRPATLRARCSVGYRDARLIELSRLFLSGAIDQEWYEDPARSDEEIFKALLELPGVGPYGAGNILQLLGRYSRLALDTESVRHGRMSLGMTGETREIEKLLRAHYEGFGEHRFRSYWFELWAHYEGLKGPAWTWDPAEVGAAFTASKLRDGAEVSAGPTPDGSVSSRRKRGGGRQR